ncbi:unnamed protein product [Adineta steineri]|uniref:G-protein coupled receptors family 1 profile domain-containing protein n=1 Tax=Adineta steineri TaxID=433720 RepID=A0A818LLL2_9BILA|nr:unnamed protein product [Adineta steineri]CAF3576611.1 unnamed protein product [Adineta steineri]
MSILFVHNETMLNIESWFISFDILSILFTLLVVGCSIFYLLIIILNKMWHSVPMMLITNSCLAHLIFGVDRVWIGGFRLQNDLRQIQYEDNLCIFRIYIAYVACAILNFSYLLQSIYRYIYVVYPSYLFWQSRQIQFLFICLTWIFSITYPFLFIFKREIIYDVHNHVCQLPFQLSFSLIYMLNCSYIIPVFLIMITYFKLVLYVHMMSKRVIPVNIYIRAKRQLRMVRNIVILIMILLITGFPYGVFVVMSFFKDIPKYHCRFSCVFFDVFSVTVMIALYQFTDPIKMSVMGKIKQRRKIMLRKYRLTY